MGYLSGKLGLVTGKGLFSVLRSQFLYTLVYLILGGVTAATSLRLGLISAAGLSLLIHVLAWMPVLRTPLLVLDHDGGYLLRLHRSGRFALPSQLLFHY